MSTISVKRPRDPAAIRALIRERKCNVERLEAVLALSLPAQDRKHLQQRLAGERANLQSWIDYLSKQQSKRRAA
jgi:hypothetical protein